ncbi:MAG: ABC transporter permease [Clostridia bacterium]|nr:ABC transporter permease [Clostridia bacterium]
MNSTPVQNTSKPREPLFHIVKRPTIPLWKSWLIRAVAILAAFLVCGIITFLLVKRNPLDMYIAMFRGSFGSSRKIWKLVKDIAILLCISLAVTPAFRMKFWNIGAEGQVLVGCLATTACLFYLGGKVPDWCLILLMLVTALIAGAAWGVIPALFKAKWKTNETLFTLMMNYVATYLVAFFLLTWTPDGSSTLGRIEGVGMLPVLFGNAYVLIILVVAILTIAMYVYLNYTKHGYEISVVGESENTARYIGISVPKVIIRTMLVSGALCGLAGFLIVGGLDRTITTESAGGQGFTAIMVSWLAKFDPLVMILTSFLLIFLDQGAAQVAQDFNMSDAFPSIITGIILFFIIGCEFFINYKVVFRSAKKEGQA